MNDLKIIRYELKRLIFSKYYVFLLLITGLFAYYILSQKVILGTAYTAPFSNWSYTTFLCDMLPYLLNPVVFLYLCSFPQGTEGSHAHFVHATGSNPILPL